MLDKFSLIYFQSLFKNIAGSMEDSVISAIKLITVWSFMVCIHQIQLNKIFMFLIRLNQM